MLEFSRAVSGLRVAEQNLFITANNLSNVNTEGYKRQQLGQREFPAINMGSYSVGLGVDADIETAKEWYQKAADNGDEDAKAALSRLDAE